MLLTEPYNETVRACFHNAAHVGELSRDNPQKYIASAADSAQSARIVLASGIDAGVIREMRFRVWGCPHLIAAAEWLCGQLESGPAAAMENFPLQEIMRQLSVPVEKTGRILLLEDALKSLARQWSGAD